MENRKQQLSLEEFGDHVLKLFPQLLKEISRHESNYLTKGKITFPQFWALEYLKHHAQCKMNKLTQFMKVSFSTATGMVDRMVKDGLVVRTRGEEDRRTVLLSISDKGKGILKEVYAQKRKSMMRLFSRLSPKERAEYIGILEKLVKNLSSTQD